MSSAGQHAIFSTTKDGAEKLDPNSKFTKCEKHSKRNWHGNTDHNHNNSILCEFAFKDAKQKKTPTPTESLAGGMIVQ